MKHPRALTLDEYKDIKEIALLASSGTDLDASKCYTITLLYYLLQFSGLKEDNIPYDYVKSAMLLYKNPNSSYIHYRNNIIYSNDAYAKAIKNAEINFAGGDDPRCPW